MNLVNKTISIFSPKAAYERQVYSNAIALLGGTEYESNTSSPHYNPYVIEFDSNDDIVDLKGLRATAQYHYNNNGFYAGTVNCATDHVVGSGLRAKASIRKSDFDNISEERIKQIEEDLDWYFTEWADSTICDITGKDNFELLQRLAYRGFKRDGDMFATLPLTQFGDKKYLQVNLIDAMNVKSSNTEFKEGILASKYGAPIKYSIYTKNNDYEELNASVNGKKNVIHLFERKKAKQLRGVPFLNTVTRDLVYINDYMKTELNASRLAALFFGSIKSQAKDPTFGGNDLLGKPGDQKQTAKNTVKENSITQLMPGDELNIHTQGRENANFDKFVMTCLKNVSASTRIPIEIILAQFVSSYSASRAAMLQMSKFANPERTLFANSFCKPIRDQVITWGILQGDLVIPEFWENKNAILRAKWIGEPAGSVDPLKDINAKIKAIDNNLETYEKATMELNNGDFETNIQDLKSELTQIAELSKIRIDILKSANQTINKDK